MKIFKKTHNKIGLNKTMNFHDKISYDTFSKMDNIFTKEPFFKYKFNFKEIGQFEQEYF